MAAPSKAPALDRVFPPAECDDRWAVKVLFPHQYGSWTTPSPEPVGGEA